MTISDLVNQRLGRERGPIYAISCVAYFAIEANSHLIGLELIEVAEGMANGRGVTRTEVHLKSTGCVLAKRT